MRGRSYTPSPPRGYGRRGRSPSPRGRYGGRSRDAPTSLLVRNLRHDCRFVPIHYYSYFIIIFFWVECKNSIVIRLQVQAERVGLFLYCCDISMEFQWLCTFLFGI